MSQTTKPNQPEPKIVQKQKKQSQIVSPTRPSAQIKMEKKKKEKALMQFLSKPQNDGQINLPIRTQNIQEQKLQLGPSNCKICGQLSQRYKACQFCKDIVCIQHLRKRRKLKGSNKFGKICDDCQDKQIYDKYMKLQNKAEEALAMQQILIQAKRDEIAELLEGKKTKIKVILNKKQQLEDQKKQNENKIKAIENEYIHKLKKQQLKLAEQRAFQQQINLLQKSLPPPLDDDYGCLVEQNSKITKQLVKYQKLCAQALKANSTRQKQLYQAYYNWQKKEATRAEAKKKAQECVIY